MAEYWTVKACGVTHLATHEIETRPVRFLPERDPFGLWENGAEPPPDAPHVIDAKLTPPVELLCKACESPSHLRADCVLDHLVRSEGVWANRRQDDDRYLFPRTHLRGLKCSAQMGVEERDRIHYEHET